VVAVTVTQAVVSPLALVAAEAVVEVEEERDVVVVAVGTQEQPVEILETELSH
jgi:hypothetical protein